jgi:ammonia channel protein AmtB
MYVASVSTGCTVVRPWEGFVIGAKGGTASICGAILIDKIKIDHIEAFAVHVISGIWVG